MTDIWQHNRSSAPFPYHFPPPFHSLVTVNPPRSATESAQSPEEQHYTHVGI